METIKRITGNLLLAVLQVFAALLAIMVALIERAVDLEPLEQTYFAVLVEVTESLDDIFKKKDENET